MVYIVLIFLVVVFTITGCNGDGLEPFVQMGIKIYPVIRLISGAAIIFCFLIFTPLAFFRRTKYISGQLFYYSSYIFGIALWVFSFLLTYDLWGGVAVFIGFILLGFGIVPMAILATLFNGQWINLLILLFNLILIFGTRYLGIYLRESNPYIYDAKSIKIYSKTKLVEIFQNIKAKFSFIISDASSEFVETYIPQNECATLAQKKQSLLKSIENIPDEFYDRKTEYPDGIKAFDANRWLKEVYDTIKLNEGYVLDYVYANRTGCGEPFLYSRKNNSKPIKTVDEYFKKYPLAKPEMFLGDEPTKESSKPFTSHLTFELSPRGCFHFGLFVMTSRRFYLQDHSNYNDRKYMLTKKAIEYAIDYRLGNLTDEECSTLSLIDPTPLVRIKNEIAEVVLFCYEINSGYLKVTLHLKWPNKFEGITDQIIIKRDIQLLY